MPYSTAKNKEITVTKKNKKQDFQHKRDANNNLKKLKRKSIYHQPKREEEQEEEGPTRKTYGTEVGVLHDVVSHHAVLGGQRHDEEQGIPGLLADGPLPVNEGDEKGEDEEVRSPLVLTGVEEELQDGWIFGKNGTELIEQDYQLRLHSGGGCSRAGAQQHHQGLQNGLVVQQRLVGLGDQHLVHLELLHLRLIGEFPPQAPKE